MLNTIETGVNIGTKSVDFIETVIGKIEKYQRIKQDTTVYLRLLYIEIVNNLEVLKTVNFDKFSNTKANDPKIKTIIKLLQTDILESVFYKSDENKNIELYEKLRKRGKINNKGQELIKTSNKGDEIKAKSSFVYENILQAISFVVTKIEVMRKYSTLTNEELAIVKNMNLKTRLININQRLLMIKNVMDGFDEIKEMAR
ncbi:MAG TPA: hypothetical protein PLH91_09040 [Tenuifilaceae bacterium]|nr:hypothetical protein [Tenuifilaceae bacterium]HOZ15871.1 hypothetical protein [Tenuifilaceae bacterium]HPI45365.1 hypothetical protein [Tenuifilaceae bacterium]HPN20660.1 hypothetical protein [Tenuifilaceae bacterium]HPV56541.1 hypothetical protein [Tenuifilaceae bacterium]